MVYCAIDTALNFLPGLCAFAPKADKFVPVGRES